MSVTRLHWARWGRVPQVWEYKSLVRTSMNACAHPVPVPPLPRKDWLPRFGSNWKMFLVDLWARFYSFIYMVKDEVSTLLLTGMVKQA